MSGRALAYLTDFFGTDSHAEVRKSTLQTPYWESIGSAFSLHPMFVTGSGENKSYG